MIKAVREPTDLLAFEVRGVHALDCLLLADAGEEQ